MAKYERALVLPPEALRNPVRFQLDAVRNYLYRRVVRTVERGLNGDIPAKKAPSYAVGLKAAQLLLERIDPVAKGEAPSLANNRIVIEWDTSAREIAPAGDRSAPSSGSSNGSNGSTYWSAIEGGERPPSA